VCGSVLQCAAVRCGALQRVVGIDPVALCCAILQCVAACCSVLQRVAACYIVQALRVS